VKRVRLPDYLRRKPSLASIAQIAYERRARRTAAKEDAEHRVHLCEEQLQNLRQELSDAERELQEVESNVLAWQKFFSEFDLDVDGGHGETSTAIDRNVDVDIDASGSFLFPDNIAIDIHQYDSSSTSSSVFDSDV
jgi:DNA-binding transcriptional MerR regulator